MLKAWKRLIVALCVYGLFDVEFGRAAVVEGYDSSARHSETTLIFGDGHTVRLKEGQRAVVHEPCVAQRRQEVGWQDVPVTPRIYFVVSLRTAVRQEPLVDPSFRRRRIVLQYPPVSSPWHLPAGIAQLAPVLEADNHEVVQRYGHIAGLEHVLLRHGGADVRKALAAIRDPKSGIDALYEARMTLERVSKAIPTGERKFAVERNNVSYISAYYDGTLDLAVEAFDHREEHLFYEYFVQEELPPVREARPEIYGVSINDERQLVPGLILASLVKEASPETLVVVGGNFWPRMMHAFQMPAFARLFDHVDAIVYREGHIPLCELAATLDPSSASGTVWRDGGRVVVNPPTPEPVSFEHLPTPVFENAVRQWSPDRVYSLYTRSNCMMACTFCAISAGSDTFLSSSPRAMSPARIAEHMAALGTHRFEIFDETFPVAAQIALGEELKKIGYQATWECYLTVTKNLERREVCQQLYDAGCRAVQLGLETLSPETLARERKSWNIHVNYGLVLENLAAAGIQVHGFIMAGTPGEELHWNLLWLAFVERYGPYITTLKPGRYRDTRMSPDAVQGLLNEFILVLPDAKPLHLNHDFAYRSPRMSKKRLDAIYDLLEEACRRHELYAVTSTIPWWVNRGRFTRDELLRMGERLPPEPPAPHLERALVKISAIVRDELGVDVRFRRYEDVLAFAKTLA